MQAAISRYTMNFYGIDVVCLGGAEYAWASCYGPIAEMIDDIPFLKDASEAFKKGHSEFWRIAKSLPGIKLSPGGKAWPDLLACGGGPPHFFVSGRMLSDLHDYGIEYLRATEMPLIEPFPKKLRELPPPKYYVLEAIPGLDVSWAAMGIPHDKDNRSDFSGGLPKPWPPTEWKVSRSSWTGFDLMSYKNWQMPMTLVCTDEIKDLAKARKWTNIRFQPLVSVD